MSSYDAASSICRALLQEQSSQGWMRRMLLGESAAAKFKELQSKVGGATLKPVLKAPGLSSS